MTIALLRNKQLLALVILAFLTIMAITFILLSTVAHINLLHTFTGLIFPYS